MADPSPAASDDDCRISLSCTCGRCGDIFRACLLEDPPGSCISLDPALTAENITLHLGNGLRRTAVDSEGMASRNQTRPPGSAGSIKPWDMMPALMWPNLPAWARDDRVLRQTLGAHQLPKAQDWRKIQRECAKDPFYRDGPLPGMANTTPSVFTDSSQGSSPPLSCPCHRCGDIIKACLLEDPPGSCIGLDPALTAENIALHLGNALRRTALDSEGMAFRKQCKTRPPSSGESTKPWDMMPALMWSYLPGWARHDQVIRQILGVHQLPKAQDWRKIQRECAKDPFHRDGPLPGMANTTPSVFTDSSQSFHVDAPSKSAIATSDSATAPSSASPAPRRTKAVTREGHMHYPGCDDTPSYQRNCFNAGSHGGCAGYLCRRSHRKFGSAPTSPLTYVSRVWDERGPQPPRRAKSLDANVDGQLPTPQESPWLLQMPSSKEAILSDWLTNVEDGVAIKGTAKEEDLSMHLEPFPRVWTGSASPFAAAPSQEGDDSTSQPNTGHDGSMRKRKRASGCRSLSPTTLPQEDVSFAGDEDAEWEHSRKGKKRRCTGDGKVSASQAEKKRPPDDAIDICPIIKRRRLVSTDHHDSSISRYVSQGLDLAHEARAVQQQEAIPV